MTYDAWNRLAKVQRAWRDADEALQTGSTVAAMQYDGPRPSFAEAS